MLLSALYYGPIFSPIDYFFDAFVHNQALVKSERIVASSQVYAETGNSFGKYIIDIDRPHRMQIFIEPVSLGMVPERYYYSAADSTPSALIYRPMTGQFVKSTVPGASLPQLVKQATPNIDELLSGLASGDGWRPFLQKLRSEGGSSWRWKKVGKETKLYLKTNAAQFDIRFTGSVIRPTLMQFGNANGLIKWTFQYLPPKKFSSPARESNAYEVAQFDAMLGTAKAASNTAKLTLDRLLARYDGAKSVAYISKTGSDVTKVVYSRTGIYQSDRFADWTYDGRRLTLYNKTTKQLFDGKATASEMIEAVAKSGTRVEVNLRSLMQGRNPFRLLLSDTQTVQTAKGRSVGEQADWLQSKTPDFDLKLAVAKSDGFVLCIESSPKMDGKVVATTVTRFERFKGSIPNQIGPPSTKSRPVSELF